MQLMDKRKGNFTLCWVPGHAGITENEEADKEAKRAKRVDPEGRKVPTRALKWMDGEQPTKKVGKREECNER
jgi:ribonuclease HI